MRARGSGTPGDPLPLLPPLQVLVCVGLGRGGGLVGPPAPAGQPLRLSDQTEECRLGSRQRRGESPRTRAWCIFPARVLLAPGSNGDPGVGAERPSLLFTLTALVGACSADRLVCICARRWRGACTRWACCAATARMRWRRRGRASAGAACWGCTAISWPRPPSTSSNARCRWGTPHPPRPASRAGREVHRIGLRRMHGCVADKALSALLLDRSIEKGNDETPSLLFAAGFGVRLLRPPAADAGGRHGQAAAGHAVAQQRPAPQGKPPPPRGRAHTGCAGTH